VPVQLNHTIVQCRDKQRSATFLTEILVEDLDGHLLEVIIRPYGSDS